MPAAGPDLPGLPEQPYRSFAGGAVQLWLARLSDCRDVLVQRDWRAVLSDAEIAHSARFADPADRHRALLARLLLRKALSRRYPLRLADWRFARDHRGKPALVWPALPLAFNLSHSADLVVCALGRQCELGVDVEQVAPRARLLALARRFFSADECAALDRLSGIAQRAAFYDIWTAREAYCKALGCGLAGFADPESSAIAATTAAGWQRRWVTDIPGYRLALCWRRNRQTPERGAMETVRYPAATPVAGAGAAA
ncbi:MAG: 4'-phosphopantetheinyl transferase superfamily protein [Gammaproteobacteria bacterium]|nr:4'-phosphopantetheinyl transferase superfamily protein [Gammaproteobacteria bacterium]